MWRRTIGRFRSEEAVYKSAERQYQTLAETLDGQVLSGSASCLAACSSPSQLIRAAAKDQLSWRGASGAQRGGGQAWPACWAYTSNHWLSWTILPHP